MRHLHLAHRYQRVVLLVVFLGFPVSVVLAEGSPLGVWKLEYRVGDRASTATLTITDDGQGFAGKWESERGTSRISDVRLERGQLTFVRTLEIGDREIRLTFEGTVLAGKSRESPGRGDLRGGDSLPFRRGRPASGRAPRLPPGPAVPSIEGEGVEHRQDPDRRLRRIGRCATLHVPGVSRRDGAAGELGSRGA